VEFRWSGRIYRVQAVLTHHRIHTFPAAPPPDAVRPELPRPRPAEPEDEIVDELSARRAARSQPPAETGPFAEAGLDAAEPEPPREPLWHDQEVWRVRANPAGVPPGTLIPGVFDLRFDWAVGRWTVTRIDTLEEQQ
jgi:hypothetical protein